MITVILLIVLVIAISIDLYYAYRVFTKTDTISNARYDIKEIATVKDLIEHLQKNFKSDDLLCFFDEGGAWIELEHVQKDFIGDKRWMFNYVKDKRQYELDNPCCAKKDEDHIKKIIVDNYKSVEDNGVVVF